MVLKPQLVAIFFVAIWLLGIEGLDQEQKEECKNIAVLAGCLGGSGAFIAGCVLFFRYIYLKTIRDKKGTSDATVQHIGAWQWNKAPTPAPAPIVTSAVGSIPSAGRASSIFRGRGQLETGDGPTSWRNFEENNVESDGMTEGPALILTKTFTVEEIVQELIVRLKREPEDIWKFMHNTYCPATKIRG